MSAQAVASVHAQRPLAESPGRQFWRVFKRDRLAMAGLMVLALLLGIALAGKALTAWVPAFDPATVLLVDKLRPPLSPVSNLVAPAERPLGSIYVLGTDDLGRDVAARMLQGASVSLLIGFVAVGIAMTIGVLLGGLAGYYGGVRLGVVTVDTLIMRFTDVMLCFPTFFLILTVVAQNVGKHSITSVKIGRAHV